MNERKAKIIIYSNPQHKRSWVMDRLKEMETFNPVPYTPDNGGMEIIDGGEWVRLSDVHAILKKKER